MEQATDHRCHLQAAGAVPLAPAGPSVPLLSGLGARPAPGWGGAGPAAGQPWPCPSLGAAGAFVLQPERGLSDVAPLATLGHFKASSN